MRVTSPIKTLLLLFACLIVGAGGMWLFQRQHDRGVQRLDQDHAHLAQDSIKDAQLRQVIAERDQALQRATDTVTKEIARWHTLPPVHDTIPVVAADPRDQHVIDSLRTLVADYSRQGDKSVSACVAVVNTCDTFRKAAFERFRQDSLRYHDAMTLVHDTKPEGRLHLGVYTGYGGTLRDNVVVVGPQAGIGVTWRLW